MPTGTSGSRAAWTICSTFPGIWCPPPKWSLYSPSMFASRKLPSSPARTLSKENVCTVSSRLTRMKPSTRRLSTNWRFWLGSELVRLPSPMWSSMHRDFRRRDPARSCEEYCGKLRSMIGKLAILQPWLTRRLLSSCSQTDQYLKLLVISNLWSSVWRGRGKIGIMRKWYHKNVTHLSDILLTNLFGRTYQSTI